MILAQALVERGMLDGVVSGMGTLGHEAVLMMGQGYFWWIVGALFLLWLWRRPKRW